MQQKDQQNNNPINNRLETLEEFSFTSSTRMKVKNQYYQLLDELIIKYPDKTKAELIRIIVEAEYQNNYKLFRRLKTKENSDDNIECYEIKELRTYKQIGVLSEQGIYRLNILEDKFNFIFQKVIDSTSLDKLFVEQSIRELLLDEIALTLTEAAEIIIYGPKILGFDTTLDPKMSNQKILEFLIQLFGINILRKVKIGKISKDDFYMIIVPNSNNFIEKANLVISQNLMQKDAVNILLTKTKNNFLKTEIMFEGVSSVEELKHLYKIRAHSGNTGVYSTINLRSFGVEKPENFDYLTDLDLDQDDKMRAYILGTIIHEIIHRYEHQLPFSYLFTYYQPIIQDEVSDKRVKFVSDYVLKHQELYNTDTLTLMSEDFAETVRIYITNPNYLKNYYPKRFKFVMDNLPFIKEGSILNMINY